MKAFICGFRCSLTTIVFSFMLYVTLISASQSLIAGVLAPFQPTTVSRGQSIDSSLPKDVLSSLLFNPSTLQSRQNDLLLEPSFGYVSLSATYEHPNFDPVRLNMRTPIASFGGATPLDKASNVMFGFGLFPSSYQDFEINGLPKRVDGKTESVFVKNRLRNIMVPLGISYTQQLSSSVSTLSQSSISRAPQKTPLVLVGSSKPRYWSVGATWLLTYDERKLFARSISDGTELVDMNSRWTGSRWVLGASLKDQNYQLGVSWMPPIRKSFKGVTYVAGYTEPRDTDQVELSPGRLGASTFVPVLNAADAEVSVQLDANRVFGSIASKSFDGISRKATGTETRDVTQWGASIFVNWATHDSFSLSAGHEPAWIRDGRYVVDANGSIDHKLGATFGQTTGMDLRTVGLSWTHRQGPSAALTSENRLNSILSKDLDWTVGIQNTRGKHTIDSLGDNPGFFSLDVWLVSCDLGVAF